MSTVLAEGERERLSASLDAGYTLPASWYADPAIFAAEHERVFTRSWQYAGALERVSAPGDYFVSRVGSIPIVVVRDDDGELRAFVNVCRHRGHEVAEGAGNRRSLQCPYHAWTYGLDGCLRAAPRADRDPAFRREDFALRPVAVDVWGPLVFVNPEAGADPLAERLGELPDLVAAGGLDLGELRFRERYDWTLDTNWKVAIENYLECYHCPTAHPGLAAFIDVDEDAYELVVRGTFSSQTGTIRPGVLGGNGRGTAPFDPRGGIEKAQYHFLWPNVTLNIEAGHPNLAVDSWIPDGPDGMTGFTDYYFGANVSPELQDEIIAFGQQVASEDNALVESVQRGLRSGTIPQGRLILPSEKLIAHFQRLVFDAVTG